MFYETRKNHKKVFKVLSCVISKIISNYVCIDYLSFKLKTFKSTNCCYWNRFKNGNKSYDKICPVFLKNKNPVVILKFPTRMLEYYFSKGFTLFDCNTNNLAKLPNDVKYRTHAEDAGNSDKVMICSTTIISKPNTLKNLAVNKGFHSSYIQT